jgi:2-dehydro-3-deoxygluconokinase
LVDVLVGNEEDYSAALGFDLPGSDQELLQLDPDAYCTMLGDVLDAYPGVSLAAATLRVARTATLNDWGAVCCTREGAFTGPWFEGVEILDRVGGGDSFASGLFYGLLTDAGVEGSLAYGVAHGALAMTTPGDTSMATLAEVERVARGGAVRVAR